MVIIADTLPQTGYNIIKINDAHRIHIHFAAHSMASYSGTVSSHSRIGTNFIRHISLMCTTECVIFTISAYTYYTIKSDMIFMT